VCDVVQYLVGLHPHASISCIQGNQKYLDCYLCGFYKAAIFEDNYEIYIVKLIIMTKGVV